MSRNASGASGSGEIELFPGARQADVPFFCTVTIELVVPVVLYSTQRSQTRGLTQTM